MYLMWWIPTVHARLHQWLYCSAASSTRSDEVVGHFAYIDEFIWHPRGLEIVVAFKLKEILSSSRIPDHMYHLALVVAAIGVGDEDGPAGGS